MDIRQRCDWLHGARHTLIKNAIRTQVTQNGDQYANLQLQKIKISLKKNILTKKSKKLHSLWFFFFLFSIYLIYWLRLIISMSLCACATFFSSSPRLLLEDAASAKFDFFGLWYIQRHSVAMAAAVNINTPAQLLKSIWIRFTMENWQRWWRKQRRCNPAVNIIPNTLQVVDSTNPQQRYIKLLTNP